MSPKEFGGTNSETDYERRKDAEPKSVSTDY
jgi:hypothetical protein